MELGKYGVWYFFDQMSALQMRDCAREIEALGYRTLWQPEARGREAFVASAWLLAHTEKLNVATGIANIYARDAMATYAAQMGLNEQSGGRFLLGLGVSHAPLVESLRGHDYGKPVTTMRNYLAAMKQASYTAPEPKERPQMVLAALGPKMLELSRDEADGAHPYNVIPEHTAMARKILGPDKHLCVEQKVIAETDAGTARAIGRQNLAPYMQLPNYRNNWLRMGFTEEDLAGEGSDKLIDAMYAWGEDTAIAARLEEHAAAGASHVCIQPVNTGIGPDMALLERLSSRLL